MELLIIFVGLAFAFWCFRDYISNDYSNEYQQTIDMMNARKRQSEAQMAEFRRAYPNIGDLYGKVYAEEEKPTIIDVTP